MVRFEKHNNKEKSSRYFNVKARCGTAYQKDNPRYYGTYMCRLWLEDKKAFYKWLDENYYVVDGEQMDIDKDILKYGNKNIGANNIDTYNEALDAFCDIKQGILVRMAKSLQDQIPDRVYQAMMNTDVKAINAKHYEIME